MARYIGKLLTTRGADEVFDYLADFSNAAEWDPGTVSAVRLDRGALDIGAVFSLRVSFLGRESDITYVIEELDPPHRVVLRGENDAAISVDTITVESSGHDTTVVYDADLRLKAPLAFALDPLLSPVFRRMGRHALASLRTILGSEGRVGAVG